MSYRYRIDAAALEDLHDAIFYDLTTRPELGVEDFFTMLKEAFEPALRQPYARAVWDSAASTRPVRRVNAWHFAILYEVDDDQRELIVTRILHERAEGLQ